MNKFISSFLIGSFIFILFLLGSSSCSTINNTQIINLENKFGKFGTGTLEPFIKIVTKTNQCTAFVIDNNYAISAAHCLVDKNQKLRKDVEFEVYTSENVLHNSKAKPAGVNLGRDFGLLQGDFTAFKPMETDFHRWRLKPNHLFYTCGYPNGEIHMICTPFQVSTNHYFFVAGAGFMYPGMSGGVVVDGEVGDVVGIIYAVSDGAVYVAPLIGFLGSFGLE